MSQLAINGGPPVRTAPYPRYVTIGEEEKKAVLEVLDSAVLSGFLGSNSPEFHGGPRVRKLEAEWAEYFGSRCAVSVNSATSALNAAVGAASIGPGDEVVVSPYTMTASATCAIVYNAVPVFADIDEETFCITPDSIRKVLTPRTKAIVVVDLFGHPADMDGIMALAAEHDLVVIEDAAQAPGAMLNGRAAGTLGHMGVFSLNCHKTIQCGEGGIVVTDNEEFAERIELIRNHGEVVVAAMGTERIDNIVGFNYRMTEVEAAIATEQLRKLGPLLQARIEAADYLHEKLANVPHISTPVVRPGVRHGYYEFAMRYDQGDSGVHRDRLVEALIAEGARVVGRYMKPIYLEPMYQKKVAFGKLGCPFTCGHYSDPPSYERGICPVTERMYFEELLYTDICHADITRKDLDDFVEAVAKVLSRRGELANGPKG